MGDNLLTVYSPSHHDVLVSGLWNLFNAKQGLDFDFQWGGNSILTHKLIVDVFLSADKLVGRRALNQTDCPKPPEIDPSDVTNPEETSQKAVRDQPIEIDNCESDSLAVTSETNAPFKPDVEDPSYLEALLEFLYNGKVAVSEEHIDKLLELARELDFQMLVDAVEATKKAESRRHPKRRQRKGNPTKLVQYKETSDADSGTDWNVPPKKSFRLTRGRKKTYVTEGSSEEEEEAQTQQESQSDNVAESEDGDFDAAEYEERTPPPKKTAAKGKAAAAAAKKRKPRKKKKADSAGAASAQGKVDRRTLWRQSQPLLKCEHCNYESRHKSRFEIHRAKHDPTVQVFRCDVCSRAFVSEDQLETHKTQAHGNGSTVGVHQCTYCEYKTRDKGWFQVHLSKHDPTVVVHRCEICGNPYSSQESLERHKVTQHGSEAKTYKCSRCAFETEAKTKYYQHLYSTHKVNGYGEPMKERYKCPDCEYTCSFRSGLRVHAKSHTQDKAFKCEHCDYASSHQGAIYRHVRTAHLHIKNLICEICGHRSATRCHLDRHIQTHTGAKPYKCDVCGQCYADRRYLNDHLRSHVSNEKTYICHICGHASARKEYLTAHLKAVHRAIPEGSKRGGRQTQQAGSSNVSVVVAPSTVEVAASPAGVFLPPVTSVPMGTLVPVSMPVTGPGGEQSMISLQQLAFNNFACL